MESVNNQTKELIPIYSLTKILSNENEMNKLLNFEINRDNFSSTNDFYDYYIALDNYAAELVKDDYSIENEMMITSFISNLLKKYEFKDEFYGSNFLITCMKNPEIVIKFAKCDLLREMLVKFCANENKIEAYYLKKFKDKNLVFTESLQNILVHLINLNANSKYVLDIFLNSNKEVQNFILSSFSEYFDIESLSIPQILRLKPYIGQVLCTMSNKSYFSDINLTKISSNKLKLIIELVVKNDSNIVNLLSNIDFISSDSIKYLISKLKDKNLLEFKSFGKRSSLKNLNLWELNSLFEDCSKDKIVSILDSFDSIYLSNEASYNLYISLLYNLNDIKLLKKYILENISDKNRFNYNTIYNSLLLLSQEDMLAVVNDKKFISNFNEFEMSFLLSLLKIDEDYIVYYVNNNYSKEYKTFDDISNEYITHFQNEINEKNDVKYINVLYYSFSECSKPLKEYFSFEDVMKVLFSNENMDKELDFSTIKFILLSYFREALDYEAWVMFNSPTSFTRTSTHGFNLAGRNMIYLNQNYIEKTPRGNESVLSTFFHEKAHHYQTIKMKNASPEYRMLQCLKELIMYDKLVYGKNGIEIDENYCKLGIECDANLKSTLEMIKFFNFVNKEYANNKYNIEKLEFKSYIESQKKQERKDYDSNVIYDVNFMFDNFIPKKDLIEKIKEYPILLFEYKNNGEKKSILDLFENMNILCNEKKRLDESGIEYDKADMMKKIRLYRELIKNRQNFVSYKNNIISNKEEKFNDWVLILNQLLKDKENVQLIDYLINSIISFNEVSSENEKKVTVDIFKILNKKLFKILPDDIKIINDLSSYNLLVNLNQYKKYLDNKECIIDNISRDM